MMNSNLTVGTYNLIYDPSLPYSLTDGGNFGFEVEMIGDLDGDGNNDIAVGELFGVNPSDTATKGGVVHIIFLNSNGTVKSSQRIGSNFGGFNETLIASDQFGTGISYLGDLGGDGTTEIAVSAPRVGSYVFPYDTNVNTEGNVYILSLDSAGLVTSYTVIEPDNPLINIQNYEDLYGTSVGNAGDRDGDGVTDLYVGTYYRIPRNAFYNSFVVPSGFDILYLNSNGTVKGRKRHINYLTSWVSGISFGGSSFATDIITIPDQTGDGIDEVFANNPTYNGNGDDRGGVIVLPLDANENIINQGRQIISDNYPGFGGTLSDDDLGGYGIRYLGDINNTGREYISFGAQRDDTTGTDRGAVYLLEFVPEWTVAFSDSALSESEVNGQFDIELTVSGPDTTGQGNQTVEVALVDNSQSSFFSDYSGPIIINIPEGDYRTAQTFNTTLTPVDDDRNYDSANEVIQLRLQNPTAGITADSAQLALTIIDDDTNDIVADPASGLIITETENSGEFMVYLTAEPPETVVVNVTNNDSGEFDVSVSSLSFTSTNWNTPQSVTVTPVIDDDLVDETGSITFAVPPLDNGFGYSGNFSTTRNVTIQDPDVFDFTISPTTQTVTEDGEVATYTITPLYQPESDIDITLALSNPLRATLDTNTITVTPGNYATPQNFTLTTIPNDDFIDVTVDVDASTGGLTNSTELVIENTDIADDNDGVEAAVENAVINNGDGNNDGTLDSLQDDVTGLILPGGDSLIVDGNGCNFSSVINITEDSLEGEDNEYDYPDGLIEFNAECASLDIDIYTTLSSGELRKYNQTFFNVVDDAVVADVVIDSVPLKKFSYTVVDGGPLDLSPAGDGRIVDPIGFGTQVIEPQTDLIRTGGY